jgi:hypothetical protein
MQNLTDARLIVKSHIKIKSDKQFSGKIVLDDDNKRQTKTITLRMTVLFDELRNTRIRNKIVLNNIEFTKLISNSQ